jgi:hypothetical protein
MAIQTVVKTQVLVDLHGTLDAIAGWTLAWGTSTPLANGDTGTPVLLPAYADKSIQVTGTFGASGSATLEGSNDGVNYFALTTPSGSTVAITAAGGAAITESTEWVRPHVTAGDGTTALVVTVFARATQQKF